jgi:hypothetical protein
MSRRWTSPKLITLPWRGDREARRKERIRWWVGVVGGVVLSCVVSWVAVGVALAVLP